MFKEPNGPCNTFCDDQAKPSRSARMSVSTQNLTHSATTKLMQFKAESKRKTATAAKPKTNATTTAKAK